MSGSLQGCEARSESIADWDGCDQTMAELLRLCSCAPHIISITMSLCNGSFGDSTSPVALPSQGVAFQAIESCRPSRLPDFERGGLMCSQKGLTATAPAAAVLDVNRSAHNTPYPRVGLHHGPIQFVHMPRFSTAWSMQHVQNLHPSRSATQATTALPASLQPNPAGSIGRMTCNEPAPWRGAAVLRCNPEHID